MCAQKYHVRNAPQDPKIPLVGLRPLVDALQGGSPGPNVPSGIGESQIPGAVGVLTHEIPPSVPFERERFGMAPRPALRTFPYEEFAGEALPPSDRVKSDGVGR
jgi:hypothetical protein